MNKKDKTIAEIAKQVEELEAFGICVPGDHMGSAADRCKMFENCHYCLVDYFSSKEGQKHIMPIELGLIDDFASNLLYVTEELVREEQGPVKRLFIINRK